MAAPVSKWWECRLPGCGRERVGYALLCTAHLATAGHEGLNPYANAPGTWRFERGTWIPNGTDAEHPYPGEPIPLPPAPGRVLAGSAPAPKAAEVFETQLPGLVERACKVLAEHGGAWSIDSLARRIGLLPARVDDFGYTGAKAGYWTYDGEHTALRPRGNAVAAGFAARAVVNERHRADSYGIPWDEIGAEEWRPVVGAPGYEVSELGQVRNRGTRLVLKPFLRGDYLTVCVDHRRRISVHVAVAEAFLGPRPAGREVDHTDGNKRNNRWRNLEWVTHRTNMQRAVIRNGGRRMRPTPTPSYSPLESDLDLILKENGYAL